MDFDSVERGLASVDRRELLDVRTTLKSICEYACERRNTSRSASILILRFFFGYYPSEIVQIVRTTRGALDMALQAARQEARLYLTRPRAIRSIVPLQQTAPLFPGISDNSHALFLELRQAIFRSCEGPCLGQDLLEQRYHSDPPIGFTAKELAHLVSCPTCLDQANTILRLPLLAERSPDATLGHDKSRGPDDPPSGPVEVPSPKGSSKKAGERSSKGADLRRRLEHKVRERFEHRPRSLQIAIDGRPRSSQKVTAAISEFHLKLSHTEHPAFIEILSEQDVRMAYLHVLHPEECSGLEQAAQIQLSEDRFLEVTFSYASDVPVVHVVYRDPIFLEDADEAFVPEARQNLSTLAMETKGSSTLSLVLHPLSSLLSALRRIAPEMNPTLATALVLFVGSLVCFYMWANQPPNITANAFLVRAEMWDSAPSNAAPGVIYQKVRIQSSRRSLERTLYRDAQGHRVSRQQPLSADDALLKNRLAQAGVDWNAPLSATAYQDWHDHQHVRHDTIARAGQHLLKLTTTVPDGVVAQTSITVRDSDFHPVKRTVELRGAGTVEIAELN